MEIFYSPFTDPYRNLALEELLFSSLPEETKALLLWRNGPSVILGRYQNAAAEVDLAETEERNVRIARRLSGGGAVYHDLGNLNYSLIIGCDDPDSVSLAELTQPAVRACRRLGADVSFGGRNDIYADGKKVSGSAQAFRNGRLLHHGCVMLSTDLSVLPKLLRAKPGKIPAGAEPSAISQVTTLSLAAGRPVSAGEFAEALIEEFCGEGEPRGLPEFCAEDRLDALQARYEDPRWTFGYPPSYEETREERFPGGLVRVHLRMENGTIADIAFSGDFFCAGDPEDLCALLRGRRAGAGLLRLLQESPEGSLIRGVTPADLYRLIAG